MTVKITDISFSYGSTEILTDISVSADRGELMALIGPNGAGKSTLLKCVNGLAEPDSGDVHVCGDPLTDLSRRDISRRIGYVPQNAASGFESTVFDFILLGRKPYIDWRASEEDISIVSNLLDSLDLQSLAMRDIAELSGGQRQKATIARALAAKPDILLLDEPTSNLDIKHQLQVLDIVRQQVKDGLTALLVIHDLNHVLRFADSVVVLDDGSVVASGDVDVLSEGILEETYDVNVHIEQTDSHRLLIPSTKARS
ncbi:ABC transporter ATP-binding protein [Natrarchaeobius sp. A-rgal3]|uniref:ABC transporter ATP-binding protein n=1 Tax=Natrarchaeobius versutus TaxID=1679078 RepID=UPI00350EDE36